MRYLTLILLFITNLSYSQSKGFGLIAEASITNITTDRFDLDGSIFNYSAGVYFQTTQDDWTFALEYIYSFEGGDIGDIEIRSQYLNSNWIVEYNPHQSVFVGAGITLAPRITNSEVIEDLALSESIIPIAFNVRPLLSVGIDLNIITIEARTSLGLFNIARQNEIPLYSIKPISLAVSYYIH